MRWGRWMAAAWRPYWRGNPSTGGVECRTSALRMIQQLWSLLPPQRPLTRPLGVFARSAINNKCHSCSSVFVKSYEFSHCEGKMCQIQIICCPPHYRESWTMTTTWMTWMTKTLRTRPPRDEARASPRLVPCLFFLQSVLKEIPEDQCGGWKHQFSSVFI